MTTAAAATATGPAFDEISEAQLRAVGSLKWSEFPEKLPAWVAEMDFGLAAPIAAAVVHSVASGQVGYLPNTLIPAMSQACSDFMAARHGWNVPAEWIRPLPDVLTALECTVRYFTPDTGRIVVMTPAYMPFIWLPASYGRELVQVPMIRAVSWEVDFAAIEDALAEGDLLVLCNPHNPIGKVYTRPELERLSEIVQRRGARVFSDEIHAPLVYDGGRHVPYASVSAAAAGHTVTATSASKSWNLAGLKTAQIIFSNAEDFALWSETGGFKEHGTTPLGVVANTAAYADCVPWLQDVLAYLDGNRVLLAELVAEHLPDASFATPEGTYLAFIDCTGLDLGGFAGTPTEFFAEQAGVVLTEGGLCGDAGAGWVRLNFATPAPILRKIVERMGAALPK
ncbi:putative aminotransferase [Arthrobacter sp. PAMC 25486]|uniref:MalY/PatB family protein n=1 Tax=Arthrobacter sp. PAMC 25486 TaxID=1494608 RepID=UPI000535DEF0|nr:aminotransferase class I/II-fold pyridoxal phosphate-dependent enzyme [Arthrobacter sp. PAMC 25486]AIY02298.1 putative aminotransferase [Arthrobacter sp. PAMC 25486]